MTNGYQKFGDRGHGYRAQKNGNVLSLNWASSHPLEPILRIEVEVPAPNKIIVKGN